MGNGRVAWRSRRKVAAVVRHVRGAPLVDWLTRWRMRHGGRLPLRHYRRGCGANRNLDGSDDSTLSARSSVGCIAVWTCLDVKLFGFWAKPRRIGHRDLGMCSGNHNYDGVVRSQSPGARLPRRTKRPQPPSGWLDGVPKPSCILRLGSPIILSTA